MSDQNTSTQEVKHPKIPFRYIYMGLFSTLVILALIATDPDTHLIQNMPFGASTLATIVVLTKGVLLVTMFHLSRKGLFDFLHLKTFFDKTLETPLSAAIALVALAIFMNSVANLLIAGISVW